MGSKNNNSAKEKEWAVVRFWHKHPVLMNALTIVLVTLLLLWLVGVVFLNFWTRHGEEIDMPQVKNLNVDDARHILEDADFEVELDSIFNSDVAPGTVLRQVPKENSKVKKGGKAYLQYVCYTVRKAKMPPIVDGPLASAINNLNNAGFENVEVQEISGDQDDLVLGASYNGLELREGMEVPVNAHIIVRVSVNLASNNYSDDSEMYPEDADAEFIEDLDYGMSYE